MPKNIVYAAGERTENFRGTIYRLSRTDTMNAYAYPRNMIPLGLSRIILLQASKRQHLFNMRFPARRGKPRVSDDFSKESFLKNHLTCVSGSVYNAPYCD